MRGEGGMGKRMVRVESEQDSGERKAEKRSTAIQTVIRVFERFTDKVEGMTDLVEKLTLYRDFELKGKSETVYPDYKSWSSSDRNAMIMARREIKHRPDVKLAGFEEHLLEPEKINELYKLTLPGDWWDSAHLHEVEIAAHPHREVVEVGCREYENGLAKIEIKTGSNLASEEVDELLGNQLMRVLVFLNSPLHARDQSDSKYAKEHGITEWSLKNINPDILPSVRIWYDKHRQEAKEKGEDVFRLLQERFLMELLYQGLNFKEQNKVHDWDGWKDKFAEHLEMLRLGNSQYVNSREVEGKGFFKKAKEAANVLHEYFTATDPEFEPWLAYRERQLLLGEILQPVRKNECMDILSKLPDRDLVQRLEGYLLSDVEDLPSDVQRYQEKVSAGQVRFSSPLWENSLFEKYHLPNALSDHLGWLLENIIICRNVILSRGDNRDWTDIRNKTEYATEEMTNFLSGLSSIENERIRRDLHRCVSEALTTVPEDYE
ncbi:MAG: hypothetical protein ABIB04_01020 [Patescibacteria group bacterium]